MCSQHIGQLNIDYVESNSRHPSQAASNGECCSYQIEPNHYEGQNQLKTILCALLKSSDDYGLRKTTKFLARHYCLTFLKHFPEFLTSHTELLMISSLRLAVKFNENVQISSTYTLECCVNQAGDLYTIEQFLNFQQVLLKALGYHLYVISPYDILDHRTQKLKIDSLDHQIMEGSLDFILTLSEFCEEDAEELVGICTVGVFQQRKISNLRLFNHIDGILKKYATIMEKAHFVRNIIERMEEEPSQLNQ